MVSAVKRMPVLWMVGGCLLYPHLSQVQGRAENNLGEDLKPPQLPSEPCRGGQGQHFDELVWTIAWSSCSTFIAPSTRTPKLQLQSQYCIQLLLSTAQGEHVSDVQNPFCGKPYAASGEYLKCQTRCHPSWSACLHLHYAHHIRAAASLGPLKSSDCFSRLVNGETLPLQRPRIQQGTPVAGKD